MTKNTITRKILAVMLILTMAFTLTGITALATEGELRFADVAQNHWAFDKITFVSDRGIMIGTAANTFSPDMQFTRAQVATVLYRIAGAPEIEFEPLLFPDLTEDSPEWYRYAAIWAYGAGVIEGIGTAGGPVFAGAQNISREQFAVMLFRFAQHLGIDTDVDDDFDPSFPAGFAISDWALTEYIWALNYELLVDFSPAGGTPNRAESASMLYRFISRVLILIGEFHIVNPYSDVNWAEFGRYRAALHVHTTRSDGGHFGNTVLHHYNLGFDILAITDHNVTHPGRWNDGGLHALTTAQASAIMAGTYNGVFPIVGDFGPGLARDPNQGGMIYLPFTNEQSFANDTNTFWANFNNQPGWTNPQVFEATANAGGFAIINHPGRYTGGAGGGAGGVISSNNPIVISRYMEWLDRFPIAGMEIFNRLDNETRSDRILWDNMLQARMPYGLPVWGFSNDDSHSLYEIGFNWNVMLMPSLTMDNARTAMEDGAFYMVTRVNRGVGPTDPAINATISEGTAIPIAGNPNTAFILTQEVPSIANIQVGQGIITIEAENYNRIEWIADGEIIATGGTLVLAAHWGSINHNYVRAQVVGDYAMALTQPFGVRLADETFRTRATVNNLVSVDSLRQVNADLDTGITVAQLGLPPMVTLVSNLNWRVSVPVQWDISGVTSTSAVSMFSVPGTFNLPQGWTNTDGIAQTVEVNLNIAPIVVTPISEIISMPNTANPDVVFTVEGYVSAAYRTDMVYIQDGSDEWSGIWVTVPGGQVIQEHVGEWVRVTGTRGVQWAQPSIITTFDDVQVLHGDPRGVPALAEPPLEAFTLRPLPVPEEWNGPWQAMMVTITAQLIERDAGHFQQGTYGLVAFHRLGGIEGLESDLLDNHSYLILVVDTANFPADIQNGDWINISQGLLRWRGGSTAHVLHANMLDGVVTRVNAP